MLIGGARICVQLLHDRYHAWLLRYVGHQGVVVPFNKCSSKQEHVQENLSCSKIRQSSGGDTADSGGCTSSFW